MLALFGMLGLVGGGALASHVYSNSQQELRNTEGYGPVLWRNEPAKRLFPETLGEPPNYQKQAADPGIAQWRRVGISEDTACAKGLSGDTKETAERLGCKAVLRATYTDLTGNTVATVAVIVLPGGATKAQEMGLYLEEQTGEDTSDAAVVPLAVPGSIAANWREDRRNGVAGTTVGGDSLPYAVATTAGAADGRRAGRLPGEFSERDGFEDRIPWMDAADNLTQTVKVHISNLQMGESK